jgi:enamine deaminase RidA (YjgF/YER057c/UK114 family)
MYVSNIARDSEAVGKAHFEVFGASNGDKGIMPAATMVETKMIDEGMLVEIEVDAVC